MSLPNLQMGVTPTKLIYFFFYRSYSTDLLYVQISLPKTLPSSNSLYLVHKVKRDEQNNEETKKAKAICPPFFLNWGHKKVKVKVSHNLATIRVKGVKVHHVFGYNI